ncbi:MAG TPA: 4Fe-4S dicluster domain-containing protein, partial [Anaeromyxobacteraceae bacterium]|nr:4Fe-4S dicluster domain-containing protein [Anaeromyxobacteraceae bacterium]
CARACPVAAIEMVPERQPGRQKNGLAPAIDAERCIGCGVCATACQKGALRMASGGAPRPVPATAAERLVRMAIERGRLADLLFDQGAGLGSRFLHHAVRALTNLPPAAKLLAAEQAKSRFVRAALGGFTKRG